ncbi:MAG TPA: 3-deoxy-7-phosphoheptulonate synthase class II [Actinomycetes bacterium]|jgi:3-deoxy-7-phosphoheptulonate synthase|nr:3-deoxy-7-phosphoheptulonate synthase class II [Actinomycetes bacterium]
MSAPPGVHARSWAPDGWRRLPAAQQPEWPDPAALEAVLEQVATLPPLVFAGEARTLQASLAQVAAGRGFLLQAGDCAESFSAFSANNIRDKLKVILQMAVVLTYGAGLPVVKVGRIAGQFAKPRSSPVEVVDGVELPCFRGDMVNGVEPTPAARRPDPGRMLRVYHQAAATLNLLRAFTTGGFADLHQVHTWNQEFVARSPAGQRYEATANAIDRALRFMTACGVEVGATPTLHQVDFYTSHEALLLGFEQAMTRQDSLTGCWYDTSAHLLWIGDRTRQLDGAHLAFLAGVGNPLGVKLGPSAMPEEVVAVCGRLDPQRVPGRLTLIARLGAARVQQVLPSLVRAVADAGHPVVWACDPMHGNTFVGPSGHKTRRFDDVMDELIGFFAVHRSLGTHPGGIHVELTGEDVTECLGGADEIEDGQLSLRYETACDPRLNASQSLELAFQVAELLRG